MFKPMGAKQLVCDSFWKKRHFQWQQIYLECAATLFACMRAGDEKFGDCGCIFVSEVFPP